MMGKRSVPPNEQPPAGEPPKEIVQIDEPEHKVGTVKIQLGAPKPPPAGEKSDSAEWIDASWAEEIRNFKCLKKTSH